MAKIRLKNLPDGFEIKNGKVVKKMQQGGMMTGDQSDYSLVTTPYNSMGNQFNDEKNSDVRYSLSSVPRDLANIEAEGGETVLTDLNDDGQFGLYNITGPRHGSGGVPMFLPEQSFVFSDTQKMKMNRQELAEFGIESRKKMTPAKVSKKFQLNEYIGAMADPFADDITFKSAELMRDKNQMSLSKLAFGQEAKKQFSDGVPVTAHPYLISQGIDPMEFTQKVENITREQAAQRMFEGLSPEQQAQVMALRQMMEQAGQMQQPQAAYGKELPKAQDGLKRFFGTTLNGTTPNPYGFGLNGTKPNPYGFGYQAPSLPTFSNDDWDGDGIPNSMDLDAFGVRAAQYVADNPQVNEKKNPPSNGNTGGNKSTNTEKRNLSLNPEAIEKFKNAGILLDVDSAPVINYRDKQRGDKSRVGLHGDAAANYEQWRSIWRPLYGEEKFDEMESSISKYGPGQKNQLVADFQSWVNTDHIPRRVKEINEARTEAGYEPLTEIAVKELEEDYIKNFGFPGNQAGSGVDGLIGTFTTSRLDPGYKINPIEIPPEETPKEGCLCDDGTYSKECCPEPNIITNPPSPDLDFYTQDLYKGAAIALRDRNMYMPFRQELERPRVDYVLEEPTRQLADINEKYNISAQAFGAFSGPQQTSARLSAASGDAMGRAADVFARVHGRNINTVNSGLARQGQLDAAYNLESARRNDEEYDATQATLQMYDNEKMADDNDFFNWQADALTNAVGAYNLSSLYDQFNINPVSGGTIDFVNGRKPKPTKKQSSEAMRQGRLQNMQDLYNQFGEKGLDAKLLQYYDQGTAALNDPTESGNLMNAYGISPEMLNAMSLARGAKGKEIKKFVVPFYTGKMGS